MLTYKIFIGLVLLVNTARLSDTSHESDADNAQKARDEHAEKQFSKHVQNMSAEQKDLYNVIKHFIQSGEFPISKEDIHCGTISVKPSSMIENELNFPPIWKGAHLVDIYTDGIRQYLSDLELRKYLNNWEKYINNWEKYIGVDKFTSPSHSEKSEESSENDSDDGRPTPTESSYEPIRSVIQPCDVVQTESMNRTTDERRTASTYEQKWQLYNRRAELSVSQRKTNNEEERIKLIMDLIVLLRKCQKTPFKLDPSKNEPHDYGTVLAALATLGIPGQSLLVVDRLCSRYSHTQFVSSWNDWKKIPKYNSGLDVQTLIDGDKHNLVLAESKKNKAIHSITWGMDEIIWNMGLRLIPFDQFLSFILCQDFILSSVIYHFKQHSEGSIFNKKEQLDWTNNGLKLLLDGNVLSFMMDAWGEQGKATTIDNYFSSPQYLMVLDGFGKVLQFYKDRKVISDSHWADAFADDVEECDLADIISSGGGHLMIEVKTCSDSVYTIEFKIVNHLGVSKDSRQCISKSIAKTSQAVNFRSDKTDREDFILGRILDDIVYFNPGTSTVSFVPGDPQFRLLISYISDRMIGHTNHPLFTTCDDYEELRRECRDRGTAATEPADISCSSDECLGATNGSDNSRESKISRESFQSSGSNHLESEQTSSPSFGTRWARSSLRKSQRNLVFPMSDSPNGSGQRSATSGQNKLKTFPKAASKLSLNPVEQGSPPKEELMTKSLSASFPCVATGAAAETFMMKMKRRLGINKKAGDKTDVRKNATI